MIEHPEEDTMDEPRARAMFETARRDAMLPKSFESVRFEDVNEQLFLGEYCWVVFASGFKNAIVREKFPGIEAAFHGFDPERIAAMDAVDPETLPIRHAGKTGGFIDGCRRIHKEGFDAFKQRIADAGDAGADVLEELPWIGPTTKYHLAKNIGFNTAKPDIWLVRCAEACDAKVDELVAYLVDTFPPVKEHEVDTILWTYCEQFQAVPPA